MLRLRLLAQNKGGVDDDKTFRLNGNIYIDGGFMIEEAGSLNVDGRDGLGVVPVFRVTTPLSKTSFLSLKPEIVDNDDFS